MLGGAGGESVNSIELYAEGKVNGGGYKYRDVKRRGIYLSLFTDPRRIVLYYSLIHLLLLRACEGDFSIYQISLIKMKKRHLVGTLLTIYKHFWDIITGIFTILLHIHHENSFTYMYQ